MEWTNKESGFDSLQGSEVFLFPTASKTGCLNFPASNPLTTQGLHLLSSYFVAMLGFLIVSVPRDSDDGASHLESLGVSAFTSRRLKCNFKKGTGLTFALT